MKDINAILGQLRGRPTNELAAALASIHAKKSEPGVLSPISWPASPASVPTVSPAVPSLSAEPAREDLVAHGKLHETYTALVDKLLGSVRRSHDAAQQRARTEPGTVVVQDAPDTLDQLIRELQYLLIQYPTAAQALFRAFIAEGREFAQTPAGQQWRRSLVDSDLVRRGRTLWEVATLEMLEERSPSYLPSQLLDAFMKLASTGELEPKLAELFGQGKANEHT